MLYLLYVLSLWIFVYTAPALAVAPGLVRHPALFASVPVISAGILFLLSSTLLRLGSFTLYTVPLISIALCLVALVRLRTYCLKHPVRWPEKSMRVFGLNALIVLPYAVKLGTTGFDSGDEIYSWNVWALQYVQGMVHPDIINVTNAPYPQLFPKFLAYGYQWLGSTSLQLPLKAALAFIPYSLLCAITFSWPENKKPAQGLLFFLLLLMLIGTGAHRYFDHAYADPLMSCALVTSLGLYVHFCRTRCTDFLLASVFCAIVAAYTKQPGLIFAGAALPAAILVHPTLSWRTKFLMAGAGVVACAYWLLGDGSGFHDNGGVLHASFQGRTFWAQLAYAARTYWVMNPLILLSFIAAILCTHTAKQFRVIVWAWLIPSLVMWFLYGAYDLRLGIHVVFGSVLLSAATGFSGLSWPWSAPVPLMRLKAWPAAMGVLSLAISGYLLTDSYLFGEKRLSPYNSGPIVLAKYFGEDAPWVTEHLYNQPNIHLWTPTDYVLGLFYEKTPIMRPNYVSLDRHKYKGVTPLTRAILIEELQRVAPDYVFTTGRLPVRGAYVSRILEALAEEAPQAFEQVAGPPNRYNIITYRLHPQYLPPIPEGLLPAPD